MNKILAYPRDKNPYQELLYVPMRKLGWEIEYISELSGSYIINLLLLIPQLCLYRIKGFSIFHLHWLYPFSYPVNNKFADNYLLRLFYSIYFIVFVLSLKVIGFKIIWTVHNILPHRRQFVNDVVLTKFLSKFCDLKIVHSQASLVEMKQLGISTNNSQIVPIGAYDFYPNTITKEKAREKLKINKNAFVFLSIGKIEPYKGLVELIEAFIKAGISNSILLIAGYCSDIELKKKIEIYKNINNIHLYLKYIPDNEMQLYLNASDVVTCTYLKVTTSSTVNLATSFGKPIIFPKIGNMKELPEDIGFPYDPSRVKLWEILKKVSKSTKLDIIGGDSKKYSKNLSWHNIAKLTNVNIRK